MGLKERIRQYCEKNHISGVLRVTVQGKTVHEQSMGYADFENAIVFTKDSMFSFYSLSKPFCAIALLKLLDKGLVSLDNHPAKYVPEAAGFDPNVTIRHLLTHTSGLPDFGQLTEFTEKYAPGYSKFVRDHVKAITQYPSYFPAGTGAMYANINFVLCALIIENVSGLRYAEYMKKEIFEPLGMRTAVVDNEELTIPHRVKGYILDAQAPVEVGKSHDWMFGAGDIVGTVDDVYCLNKAIKNRALLTEKTWNTLLTPSPLNQMGMGCTISDWHGKYRITHNGGHTGFRTLHIQLPEDDFDIILLSNSGFGEARGDISEMVYQHFYGDTTAESQGIEMDKGYI